MHRKMAMSLIYMLVQLLRVLFQKYYFLLHIRGQPCWLIQMSKEMDISTFLFLVFIPCCY